MGRDSCKYDTGLPGACNPAPIFPSEAQGICSAATPCSIGVNAASVLHISPCTVRRVPDGPGSRRSRASHNPPKGAAILFRSHWPCSISQCRTTAAASLDGMLRPRFRNFLSQSPSREASAYCIGGSFVTPSAMSEDFRLQVSPTWQGPEVRGTGHLQHL